MSDAGEGFGGRFEVVGTKRGYRRWSDELKARIVAESFQPGARVSAVAQAHGVAAHQLSGWRRMARNGDLVLAAEALPQPDDADEPAFVPLALARPETDQTPAAVRASPIGVIELAFGPVTLRLPGDMPVERIAGLVRALAPAR